jgi:hypothetical protein
LKKQLREFSWKTIRLARQFGSEQIFMDIDDIPVGEDFIQLIDQRIRTCDVMVALIGKNWLTLLDHAGRRRVDDSTDSFGSKLRRLRT